MNSHDEATQTTVLMVAVKNDQLAAIQELLASGAPVDAADVDGNTALHHCRSQAAAQMVLRARADPFITNATGKRASEYHTEVGELYPSRAKVGRFLETMVG